ncbi:hypothetical protein Y032_0473g2101 [Ancylostoma ceylanicum]|uniref:Uncharacterized protein n=1 Tax=Ancylostoma ceylanicum TaxID=53326 RepID=A0A016WXV4_9BILA|nr:hypothetical protein Y032_0473g2101 [Ancylostoma ceylanicum]
MCEAGIPGLVVPACRVSGMGLSSSYSYSRKEWLDDNYRILHVEKFGNGFAVCIPSHYLGQNYCNILSSPCCDAPKFHTTEVKSAKVLF